MTGQQLRNSILQEAIQGRLVSNVLESGEKTGAELLRDILAARQKKEIEEKGKKAKKLTLSTIEEEPWELPEGWCWCKLGDVISLLSGRDLEPNQYNSAHNGIPYITGASNFDNGSIIINRWTPSPVCVSSVGDLLITCKGTVGELAFNTVGDIHIARQIMAISAILVDAKYIKVFLKAKVGDLNAQANGVIPGISREDILLADFPLPPLSIQKAIVAKIEELFPIVDEYDKANGELVELNKILPDKLRKSVLQEAIHGTLVPNDIPEGEATASELLQQILKERQEKENKEKGKKAKKLSLSTIEEEPWELPKGWCWCHGKDIFFPMESIKPSADFVYIDTDAVNNKKNIIDNPKRIQLKDAPSRATRKLHANDILFSMVRPYLKNIAYVDECFASAIGTTGFYVITTSSSIYQPYLFKMMLSDYVVSGLTEYMKGDNSPSINNGHIEDFLYPLPPLSVQHRIVEKIEEVFAAIDKLPTSEEL